MRFLFLGDEILGFQVLEHAPVEPPKESFWFSLERNEMKVVMNLECQVLWFLRSPVIGYRQSRDS